MCPKSSGAAEASLSTFIEPEFTTNKTMPKTPCLRRGYSLLRPYSKSCTPRQSRESRLVTTFYLFLGVTLPFIPPALESARYRNTHLNKNNSQGDTELLRYIFLGPDLAKGEIRSTDSIHRIPIDVSSESFYGHRVGI